MSLINDALKKAQMQRSSSPAATTSTPGAQPKKKSVFRIATVIGLCAVLLSAISVGTTLFILHDDTAAPTKTVATKPTPPTAALSSPATSSPTVTPASLPVTAPAVVTVAAIAPPGPTPVIEVPKTLVTASATLTPAATITPSPTIAFPAQKPATAALVPAVPSTVTPAPTPTPPPTYEPMLHPHVPDPTQPSPSTQSFIDKFRVAGIRVSDTESKVILNEHLFRLNEVIEPGLGLRLTAIESHALTFTDGNGFSYMKRF